MRDHSIMMKLVIFINSLAVCLHTLIDNSVITFLVINFCITQNITSFLNLSTHKLSQSFKVIRFDAVVHTTIMKYLKAHFMMNQQKFYNTLFIIVNIDHYNLIIDKLFLKKFNILIDSANHHMIWSDKLSLLLSVLHQHLMYSEQIQKQEINHKYQAELDRRDTNMSALQISKLLTEVLQISAEQIQNTRKFSSLKMTEELDKPVLRLSKHTYRLNQTDIFWIMKKELANMSQRSCLMKPSSLCKSEFTSDIVKLLTSLSITLISSQTMICNLKWVFNKIFITLMLKIDAVIWNKFEECLALKNEETQQLLRDWLLT